jgi:hypothetical protein
VQDAGAPPSIRTRDVFGHPPCAWKFPLNRKTTANGVQTLPLATLAPTLASMPTAGLAAYLTRPRRDPPDVAHLTRRDGSERFVIQEGHTRAAAALLNGATTMPVRVWQFVENDRGGFDPVPRGLHKRGLRHREKLQRLSHDLAAMAVSAGEAARRPYRETVLLLSAEIAGQPAPETYRAKLKRLTRAVG